MKLFYYIDEVENLFEEEDALHSSDSSVETLIEYLYDLDDDNISYVGFIENNEMFKIMSDAYDKYIIYIYLVEKKAYVYFKEVNFEDLKMFVEEKVKE